MFQQGLSGLNAASKSLDVIGNNIANASTVGFKGSSAQFADLYANSLNGLAGNNPGIGVSISRIAQQFTQGNIETSNNPLDVSINGGGFFRTVTPGGSVQYSRNGQFQLDKNGTIINAQGAAITGYLANNDGVILAGAPKPITIDYSDLVPVATTKANFQLNLSSNAVPPTKVPFDVNDPLTYNKQSVLDVYDSLGNAHVMSMFYVKTAANNWDVYTAIDGVEQTAQAASAFLFTDPASAAVEAAARQVYLDAVATGGDIAAANLAYSAAVGPIISGAAAAANATAAQIAAIDATYTGTTDVGAIAGTNPDKILAAIAASVQVPAVKTGSLIFSREGQLDTAAMAALPVPQTLPFSISLPLFPDKGSVMPLVVSTDFVGTTQFEGATAEKFSTQDGYSSGQLQRFSTGPDGVITGQYSNGKSRALGQFVLANFANPDGLIPLGNNAWTESDASGQPQIGTPNTGQWGQLRSSSVETSNVDLTEELVDMITAQRVYQANAQTIKTQDSVLQTLVNLR
ncbi:flagellar hook protein FlgE [Pseudoduganella sp. OTU4001]|uniref:flagellar hook protein FlgE n=1 Tax=Pseudoduganella sp. OTU4001 TaxID=3043854 RepID=UPI00313BABA6